MKFFSRKKRSVAPSVREQFRATEEKGGISLPHFKYNQNDEDKQDLLRVLAGLTGTDLSAKVSELEATFRLHATA